ncbi:hypothetical protein MRX96_031790 [Rhipicephalus microplus]
MQAISEQRERSGFHAYYQDGFNGKEYFVIFPWFMRDGCVFTTLFFYPSKKSRDRDNSEMCLGQYNLHLKNRIKLYFQKTDAMYMQIDLEGVSQEHVQVFLNGKEVVFRNPPTGPGLDEFVVFYSLHSTPRFAMLESHYTMKDTTLIRTTPAHWNRSSKIYFRHDYNYVATGGYALWNGRWPKGTKVEPKNNKGDSFAPAVEVPNVENMVVVLKIYSTGCTFFDANATSTTPTIQSTVRAIRLVNLSIQPDPDVLVEFTVVRSEYLWGGLLMNLLVFNSMGTK